MQNSKIKTIPYIIAAVLFCVITIICGQVKLSAFADTVDGVQAAYENINVWDNLQGAVIGGEKFDIADYPHKDRDEPRIIQFVELCYSYYSDKQSDYGLYIYVYNPQDLVFDTKTTRNTINMKFGNLNTDVYPLEFINYCNKAGYEGRFYEFKVGLTNSQIYDVLHSLKEDSREYEIVSFTLSVKNVLKTYTYAQKWTYSGFVKGYGSELAESDTLSCTVDGFQKYIELNVKHTTYRREGDYYNGEQSQLDSCYFRVPNRFFDDYGALSKIVMQWYEYFTKPILVTNDSFVYNRINNLHGNDTNNLPDDTYILFNVFWENADESWFGKSGTSDWTSNYGYEIGDTYHWGFLWLNGVEIAWDSFSNFAAAFYTGSKSLDDYTVASSDLQQRLLANSKYVDGENIHGEYSKYLFEDYVQQGAGVYTHEYGFNTKTVTSEDFETLFTNVTTKGFWQTVFGGFDHDTFYDDKKAFEIVTSEMLKGSDSKIAEDLCVNEEDVQSIKDEFKKAESCGEKLVLLRYSSTKYMCAPCTVSYCKKSEINDGKTLVKNNTNKWSDNNFNAYVAQETVYLDFQIISLWFTAEDGTETEVPVVMTPQDVIPSLQRPLEEDYHNQGKKNLLGIIIAVIAVILFCIIFAPILPTIISGIVKIITLPFKLIAKLFKRRE